MDLLDFWFLDAAAESRQHVSAVCAPNAGEFLNRPGHGLSCHQAEQRLRHLVDQALISISPSSFYGLTAAGGAEWERLAKPEWSRFHSIGYSLEPAECIVEAADQPRLFEAISHTGTVCDGFSWDSSDIKLTHLEPWRPVYWKELPEGWRAMYPLVRSPGTSEQRLWNIQRQQEMERYWEFFRWRSSPLR